MKNKRLVFIFSTIAVLLSLPLITMQFTTEVNWTLSDFIIAAVLLTGTGLLCEMVLRHVIQLKYRLAICGGILLILFLIWAELAVGLFGTPFAGN
jgi:energy-converting hydrogenase Eha subunit A